MSKDNRDFFKKKKYWSHIKDDLLAAYLMPYLGKILSSPRPLLYVDGFAGKGRFEDGASGSPVIACEQMMEAKAHSKKDPRFDAIFIEKEHSAELAKELKRFSFAQVVAGNYESEILNLRKFGAGRSLFLYVDPYGIKHLDCSLFDELPAIYDSAEVLLNFNSFGFFRAACRLYEIECDIDFLDEIEEMDPWNERDDTEATASLSKIIGGDYWKPIIQDYKNKEFNGYDAEIKLTKAFCERLNSSFEYVLNIPIRISETHRPKYRMIHMSNHHDGCLLMYDNMQKRLTQLHLLQHNDQESLFHQDSESNMIIDIEDVFKKLENHVYSYEEYELIEKVLATFVVDVDLSVSIKELKSKIKEMEKDGLVDIKRLPELTKTGKKSSFMDSKTNLRYVFIRKHHV